MVVERPVVKNKRKCCWSERDSSRVNLALLIFHPVYDVSFSLQTQHVVLADLNATFTVADPCENFGNRAIKSRSSLNTMRVVSCPNLIDNKSVCCLESAFHILKQGP